MTSNQQAAHNLTFERILLAIGVLLIAIWVGAWVHRTVMSRAALAVFEAHRLAKLTSVEQTVRDPETGRAVDFSLWSPRRVEAFKDSLATKVNPPLAILRVPKINLQVPVFDDTDDLTLNRGLGRIIGTAHLGQGGNLALAGHRDGFFRGLKDVGLGETIELVRPEQTDTYIISKIQIVNPDDVSVLRPTPTPTLTLVTCFPFYYVGSAPQRFIVTASLTNSSQTNASGSVDSNPNGKKSTKEEKKQ
jgi:sortase A